MGFSPFQSMLRNGKRKTAQINFGHIKELQAESKKPVENTEEFFHIPAFPALFNSELG
jgi:hypothetical protein